MEEHSDYMRGFVHRTTMLLGEQRMATLADCTVAIAGCGGVGGATAITLARLGVGGFVLADPGIFDPPDLNRQWAGTRATLDQNKARVHRDLLLQINPNLRLTVFEEGVTDTNLDAFLEPADLLLDCLDISVPLPLRSRVYRAAQQRGLHGITAPIFGFGTMIVIARPDGMGMDAMIEQFVEVASRDSKLPPGFPGYFFGPHLDAVEREIHKHRVPTSSISVTVATGFVAAEIVRILLGASYPELDPSPTLPDVVVIDPLRLTLAVVPYTALFHAQNAVDRVAALQAADQNPVLLPAPAIDTDALSDSWSELPPPVRWAPKTSQQLEDLLAERFGFPHNLPVFRGRFAEACLAPAILQGPGQVVTNGLFRAHKRRRSHQRTCSGENHLIALVIVVCRIGVSGFNGFGVHRGRHARRS